MTGNDCCPKSLNSYGLLHNLDCPAYCPAHDCFECTEEPDPPHYANDLGQLIGPPRRVLSFTGTRADFLDYLNGLPHSGTWRRMVDAYETYEWEITASIVRHPAGKGLGRGN
jgi:hypothetical protein